MSKIKDKYLALRMNLYKEMAKEIAISKKEEKVIDTTIAFELTNYKGSNIEISEITGISKSSVQRYLNDEETITKLFSKEQFIKIQSSLKENIKTARKTGGINSTKKHTYIKDEKGKFVGIKQKRI